MILKKQKNNVDEEVASPSSDNRMSVATPLAVGAVIGGAIGAAASIAMQNDKTRKMVTEVFNSAKDYVSDKAATVEKKAKETTEDMREKTEELLDKKVE